MTPPLPASGARYSNVPRAAEALHNEQALFVLLVTGLLAGALMYLAAQLAGTNSFALAGASVFIALIVFPGGGAMAGLLLMDQARGLKPRPIGKAALDATSVALRLFAVFFSAIVAVAIFGIVVALLFFLCKVPVAGPALYAVLFPVLAALTGFLFLVLYAALAMAGPAVLSGASVGETMNMLWRIAVHRAGELLVDLFLLTLFVGVAALVLFGIFLFGRAIMVFISSLILGGSFKLIDSLAMALPDAVNGEDAQFMMAYSFGSQIGAALVTTAIAGMAIMGVNLIYLRLAEELATVDEATWDVRTTSAYPEKQEPTIQIAPDVAPPLQPAASTGVGDDVFASLLGASPPRPEAEPTCHRCNATVGANDLYCGECGARLRA